MTKLNNFKSINWWTKRKLVFYFDVILFFVILYLSTILDGEINGRELTFLETWLFLMFFPLYPLAFFFWMFVGILIFYDFSKDEAEKIKPINNMIKEKWEDEQKGKRIQLEIEIKCNYAKVHNYLIAEKIERRSGKFSLTGVVPDKGYDFNLIKCPHCNEIIPLKIYNIKQIEKEAEETRPLYEKRIQERKDVGMKIITIGGYCLIIANVIILFASFLYESNNTQIEDIFIGFLMSVLVSSLFFIIGLLLYFEYQNFKGQYSKVADFYLERGTYSLVESWPRAVFSIVTKKFEVGIEGSNHYVGYNTNIPGMNENIEIGDFGQNYDFTVAQEQILNKYYNEFKTEEKEILGYKNDIEKRKREGKTEKREKEKQEDDKHVTIHKNNIMLKNCTKCGEKLSFSRYLGYHCTSCG
jgi:hypothetical protein